MNDNPFSNFYDGGYGFASAGDLLGDTLADPNYEPTAPGDLNAPAWHDARAWHESDWVYFPMSSNVYSSRYCRDGSYRMQVMYGGKIRSSKKRGHWYDPARLYEYQWDGVLTEDAWYAFMASPSKGGWTWANIDARHGSGASVRPLV